MKNVELEEIQRVGRHGWTAWIFWVTAFLALSAVVYAIIVGTPSATLFAQILCCLAIGAMALVVLRAWKAYSNGKKNCS